MPTISVPDEQKESSQSRIGLWLSCIALDLDKYITDSIEEDILVPDSILLEKSKYKYHCSLSRPFNCQANERDAILQALKKNLCNTKLDLYFDEIPKFLQDAKQEKWHVCYEVFDMQNRLKTLVSKINEIIASFKKDPYFEEPIFHVSFFTFTDKDKKDEIEKSIQKLGESLAELECKNVTLVFDSGGNEFPI